MIILILFSTFSLFYILYSFIDEIYNIAININYVITNRNEILQKIQNTPNDRKWLYIKIFFKGTYLTVKNRLLMFYLNMIAIYTIITDKYQKYKIIGAIDGYGRDISLPVKAYFAYIDLPTTQSLEQYLSYYETVILYVLIDNKPVQMSIDLQNRKIITSTIEDGKIKTHTRSLIGGLITFDEEDEEEIDELSE